MFFFDVKKTPPEVNGILDIYIFLYVSIYIYIDVYIYIYVYILYCFFFGGGGGRPVIPNLSRWPWMSRGR